MQKLKNKETRPKFIDSYKKKKRVFTCIVTSCFEHLFLSIVSGCYETIRLIGAFSFTSPI